MKDNLNIRDSILSVCDTVQWKTICIAINIMCKASLVNLITIVQSMGLMIALSVKLDCYIDGDGIA